MRYAAFLAAALLLAAAAPQTARAATLHPPAVAASESAPIVEAAVRCGPRAHYVRGHRARNGQWIKGRCVRNRHH